MLTIGSLFSGYGGLDIAVRRVLGGEVAWYSEIDAAACTVLAAHHFGVHNLGDITAVDWSQVEPVDVLTGGYPCQPFSHAGQRKGKADERHLWPYVRDAIGALGPRLVVLENVAGHLTLGLADVLADLAEVGYDARWGVVRAADAGAPHGRARVFIVASPADADDSESVPAEARRESGWEEMRLGPNPASRGHHVWAGSSAARYTELAADADDSGRDRGPRDEGWRQERRAAADGAGDSGVAWGRYAPAIARWERVLGRRAPAPTVPGANGRPRLSPLFVEFLMGLDEGHVTGHGLRPAQCLKMLGNGVVPQQGELALRMLLGLPVVGVAGEAALLPTPRSAEAEHAGRAVPAKPGQQQGLAETVNVLALLPTPSANDTTGAETGAARGRRGAGGPMLRDLPNLLPTPKAGDGERGRDLPRQRVDEKSRELSTAVAFMGDADA